MDSNNWKPAAQVAEAPLPTAMGAGDWRTQLRADSRQRIVNKIMETLKRHLPVCRQEGLQELRKIAVRFEEKIYTAATSQSDYLKKISLKMLTMETKSQNPMGATPGSNNKNPQDPASPSIQSQINSQGQPLPNPMMVDPAQARQQLLSQNIQNNIASTGVQGSASLTSALPAVGNLTQNSMVNVGQNSNLQNMQNISGVSQNSVGSSMGQNMPSNMFANAQRQQIQGRQQQGVPQQQQPQNSQSYLYQQQLQHQLMKQKLQQGNIPPTLVQYHIQQQQQQQQQEQQPQQNLLQPNQLQSAQQSVMQPNVMQSTSLSGNQQNSQSSVQQSAQSMLQQHQQSVLRQQQLPQQAAIIHPQQAPLQQLPIMLAQQQQHLMGQQPSAMNMQPKQIMVQQNNFPDMPQQQQRLLGQRSNLSNLQPQQQQQQLMGPQNNISNMHPQQLAPQNNVASPQQQQLLGTQSGNSSMLINQHHLLQQTKVSVQQQTQQSAATLLPIQVQQSQTQTQPLMMSQIQSQQRQLQQQIGLQQAPNSLRDMQQRLQTSGPLLQQQNVSDQQKQLYQSQRSSPEAPSSSLDSTAPTGNMNGGDWQEEAYQKITALKEIYGLELNEMYQKTATKLQQHESLPQPPKIEQIEKLKLFKVVLERIISFIQVSKSNITPIYKEKIGCYEKQIIGFLNSNRPRKSVPSPQQGQQFPPSQMNSMQPSQPAQSQITQVKPYDNQVPQMQPMNLQGSVATVQQNNMTSFQHNSLSSLTGVSNALQTMMNSLQPNSSLDPGQGNALNSLQQVAAGPLQQSSVSGLQPVNVNLCGMTSLQPCLNSLESSSNMFQQQHLKQQEPQMLQSQQFKHQFQQRQMMMHEQQIMQQQQQLLQPEQQQLHVSAKQQQQQLTQMQPTQMSQLPLINLHSYAFVGPLFCFLGLLLWFLVDIC